MFSLSETSSFVGRIVNILSLLKHASVKAAVARKVSSILMRYIFLLLLGCLPCRLSLTSEYYTAEIKSEIEPILSAMLCRSKLLKRKGVQISCDSTMVGYRNPETQDFFNFTSRSPDSHQKKFQ
jgi:hypothetical protein